VSALKRQGLGELIERAAKRLWSAGTVLRGPDGKRVAGAPSH
jgi:hypothetical protein